MGNLVPFTQVPVPAHIQKAINAGISNIDEKVTINQLSFRGKVWRQVIDGTERPLLNNDDEPVSTVHVVVLNHNKARSRAYYEGAFVEGKSTPPACWSNDGEVPDSSIREPQATSCAKCPRSVKGSKITPNGHETTECSVYKRLAVVPLRDLACPPMLLRLAQTSTWDKKNDDNEAKGYYAWDQYLDMLRKNNVPHTGYVATKIRFDSRMAYPKLIFAASRWLEDEELELAKPLFDSEDVLALLNASEVAAAARKEDANEAEMVIAKAKGKKKEVAPSDEDDDDDEPAPPPKVKGKKKAAAPPPDEDEDDEEEPAPVKVKAKKGDGLADLVDEFDD